MIIKIMVFFDLVVLVISLIVLAKASEKIIESAIKLAGYFKIGQLAVGFLLISVSTSLPELSVSIVSATQNAASITIGNVFGSNIADVLLVMGLAAAIYGIKTKREEWGEAAFILLVVSVITMTIIVLEGLDVYSGALLICMFILFVYYLLKRKQPVPMTTNQITIKEALHTFLLFAVGIVVVIISSAFVVESAIKLAAGLNLAKSFIGATILAIGTSLPELAIDLQAVRKRAYGLAIGDAIGSTMTNLTLVLGIAAMINPIVFTKEIVYILGIFSILANGLLLFLIVRSRPLTRNHGIVMLFLYGIYLITLFSVQLSVRD